MMLKNVLIEDFLQMKKKKKRKRKSLQLKKKKIFQLIIFMMNIYHIQMVYLEKHIMDTL